MKFHLILATAALLIAGSATAQHVNVGIKGGLNLYNVHQSNDSDLSSQAGYHLGLMSHLHVTDRFGLQPEIVFSTQGAKHNMSGMKSTLKLNYVNIPVMFQYMFNNGFRLQAGPQLGILLNANSVANDNNTDVKPNFNSIDFGVGLGVGYVHPTTGFGVDARYNHGLSNISENDAVKATNRGFQFGIFYLFGHRS